MKSDVQELSLPRTRSIAKSSEYQSIPQKAVHLTSMWFPPTNYNILYKSIICMTGGREGIDQYAKSLLITAF